MRIIGALSLIGLLLFSGCLTDLENVPKAFEKRPLELNVDKASYIIGEIITINATADGKKYALVGRVPFEFYQLQEGRWERLQVGLGPAARFQCRNGKIQSIAVVANEPLFCRQLELLKYEWHGEFWKALTVECEGRAITEHMLGSEKGEYKAALKAFDDPDCRQLNRTMEKFFKIT